MIIARIKNGIVLNVEVADEKWVENFNAENSEEIAIVVPEGTSAHIGLGYSLEQGFEQPIFVDNEPVVPFEETAIDENDDLGLAIEEILSE